MATKKDWQNNIPVTKGGLFEKYEGNTPLSVISEKYPEIDLSWLETIKKKKTIVSGSEILAPSLYYKNGSITGFYTAPLKVLEKLIPTKILEVTSLVSHDPENGVVAITAYDYEICDVDHYNEVSISVLLSEPKNLKTSTSGPWAYVTKLPVDSELARVGGVQLFNLPKWKIRIDHKTDGNNDSYDIYDEAGQIDFSIIGEKLDVSSKVDKVERINFINVDHSGELTLALSDTRAMKRATKNGNKGFEMKLTDGPLSKYIKDLKLGDLFAYEYKPSFQNTLYVPEPLEK